MNTPEHGDVEMSHYRGHFYMSRAESSCGRTILFSVLWSDCCRPSECWPPSSGLAWKTRRLEGTRPPPHGCKNRGQVAEWRALWQCDLLSLDEG